MLNEMLFFFDCVTSRHVTFIYYTRMLNKSVDQLHGIVFFPFDSFVTKLLFVSSYFSQYFQQVIQFISTKFVKGNEKKNYICIMSAIYHVSTSFFSNLSFFSTFYCEQLVESCGNSMQEIISMEQFLY